MKVIDLAKILPKNTNIRVRGAFESCWGEKKRPDYYIGFSQEFPTDSKYRNRKVIFTLFMNNQIGDVHSIKDADGIDIAVSDFDEESEEKK